MLVDETGVDVALERETVIRTALRLMDEVGLDKLTLHRLAAELGVQAPALYWHFTGKRDLLDAMASTVLADAALDSRALCEDLPWDEFVHECGVRLRAGLMRYRDGARVVPGTRMSDTTTDIAQWSHQALTSVGFTPETAAAALQAVYCFTVGYTVEEQAALDRTCETPEGTGGAVPCPEGFHTARYEHGLALIIAGLRARLAESTPQ